MAFQGIYANVSCISVERSRLWYAALFGRSADAAPMDGLVEWHLGETTGLQLFENAAAAGQSTVTIFTNDLDREVLRLRNAGFDADSPEKGDRVRLSQLRDPSGNLVVLVERAAS